MPIISWLLGKDTNYIVFYIGSIEYNELTMQPITIYTFSREKT